MADRSDIFGAPPRALTNEELLAALRPLPLKPVTYQPEEHDVPMLPGSYPTAWENFAQKQLRANPEPLKNQSWDYRAEPGDFVSLDLATGQTPRHNELLSLGAEHLLADVLAQQERERAQKNAFAKVEDENLVRQIEAWHAAGYPAGGEPVIPSLTRLAARPTDGSRTAAQANPVNAEANPMVTDSRNGYSVGHPGFAESFIPFWGSGREAIADFQEGDYLGAALNAGLAASDAFLGDTVAKGLGKGAFKLGSHTWGATRKWLGKRGYLDAGKDGHHWLIPQGGWGRSVPNAIKNQPWNIMPMPSREFHTQLHLPPPDGFNTAEKLWYGTPAWAKAGTLSTFGHGAEAYEVQSDDGPSQ